MDEEQQVRRAYRRYETTARTALWDGSNPGYARLAADRDRALMAVIESSLPRTMPARVLDVGCGDGAVLAAVATRWPDVDAAGIDLLEERVAAARERVPTADIRLGSARTLPFADRSFDIVLAVTLFSSLPGDLGHTVAHEIARVLRRPGSLVWYDLRVGSPRNPAVHALTSREIARLFPGWRQELRSITVLPPIARRLGRVTPIAYPALDRIPAIRSHLVGRLQPE